MTRFIACCFLYFVLLINVGLAQDDPESSQTYFISDDLFIFVHSGPGRQYRIIGSIQAGIEVVKTRSEEANNFVEITDPDGRTGWIESKFLSTGNSRRVLVDSLSERLAASQATLSPLRQQIAQLSQSANQLQTQNDSLTIQVEQLSQQNSSLSLSVANKQGDIEMQWMMKGGALVVVGMLLGVALTYLPKSRKRNDNWLN